MVRCCCGVGVCVGGWMHVDDSCSTCVGNYMVDSEMYEVNCYYIIIVCK